MHTSLSWNQASPEEVAERFEALGPTLLEKLEGAAEDIGVRIRRDAEANAPTDRTRLRDDLSHMVTQVSTTLIRIVIGTNVDHGQPIEEGTDPFFPPPSELRGWARRQLGDEDAAYPVARSISETGIEAQPYLAPALEDNIQWALDRILQAIEAAFEEVGLA